MESTTEAVEATTSNIVVVIDPDVPGFGYQPEYGQDPGCDIMTLLVPVSLVMESRVVGLVVQDSVVVL